MVLLPDIRARTDVNWMTRGVWVDGATPQIAALAKRDDVLMVSAAWKAPGRGRARAEAGRDLENRLVEIVRIFTALTRRMTALGACVVGRRRQSGAAFACFRDELAAP